MFSDLYTLLENPTYRVSNYLLERVRVIEGMTEGVPFSNSPEGGVNFIKACVEVLISEEVPTYPSLDTNMAQKHLLLPLQSFHMLIYMCFLLYPDPFVLSFVKKLKFKNKMQNIS